MGLFWFNLLHSGHPPSADLLRWIRLVEVVDFHGQRPTIQHPAVPRGLSQPPAAPSPVRIVLARHLGGPVTPVQQNRFALFVEGHAAPFLDGPHAQRVAWEK